jgi:RimJ/RimL family protein N-acetyltransferase
MAEQTPPPEPIVTPRLDLVSMSAAFLAASLAGDRAAAERELGAAVPDEWLAEAPIMQIFLRKLAEGQAAAPWLARAAVLRGAGAMIGHCGFHGPPGATYLEPYAPGGAEMGYTIFAAHRRRGYATEAVRGLMGWAAARGVPTFVLSISPENTPSQAIARRLGFRLVGSHMDPEDGLEEIFARPPLEAEPAAEGAR